MRGRWFILLAIVTIGLLWLMRTPSHPKPIHPIHEPDPVSNILGQNHDPARCGTLVCMVEWSGEVPKVKPISLFQAKVRPGGKIELPNPNAPRVGKTGGLADTLMMLRGIDLTKSRPWDLASVKVELAEADLFVYQGERRGRIGIVRRGSEAQFAARDAPMQSARARGAAFFTQMLFTIDQPVSRTFATFGMAELSSGSGHFWMRGYLAVSDHPYAGVSNESGEVRFDRVPEGTYELVCWKANWNIARIERDPEWLYQASLDYTPPVEKKQPIQIQAGKESRATCKLRSSDFESR